ncbi:MAG: AAA family ATPase, partial [Planctomycetota bacterium]|nr:AAA family ATPase [Planctomycetota bacterium]
MERTRAAETAQSGVPLCYNGPVLLEEKRLDALLDARNPWWGAAAWPRASRALRERPLEGALQDSALAGLIIGPRRSGKTSLLQRLIDTRLALSSDVAYLPVDHPVLRLVPLGPLVDRALKRIGDKSERPLVLIDGLQAVPNWPERWLELVHTRPRPRFLAATSVTPALTDPAFETWHLHPLSFREFCTWRGVPGLEAPPLDLE